MLNVILIPAKQIAPPRAVPPSAAPATTPPWGFPELFVISQTALPALLYVPGSQSLRVPIRVSAFAISLLGLLLALRMKRSKDRGSRPARFLLLAALAYLGLMVLHPTTVSLKAALAQIVLYAAVCAPFVWAPVLVRGRRHLARLLMLLLICNGLNSIVGVLQVYNPAMWMPEELSRVVTASPYGLDTVSYLGPGGRRIVRPPGLFDAPGAVCGPAMITVLLGLVFSIASKGLPKKLLAFGLAAAGMAAIYLSQVRSSLVVVTVMVLALSSVLVMMRREAPKAALLVVLFGAMILATFAFAVTLGGPSVRDRFASLLEDDPVKTFYKSRGEQLEYGFRTLLADYPFGAGLGRWGIINVHFGDRDDTSVKPIWAEVQPNAWILDGGLVLLVLYGGALAFNTRAQLRLVRGAATAGGRLLPVAVLAATVGTLAMILSFTPLTSQSGLQYWLLSGALQGAMAVSADASQ